MGNSVADLLKKQNDHFKKPVASMGVRDDPVTRLQTGMFPFDLATGGGIPEGRVTILFGPESSLKTTLLLKAIAAAQRKYPDRTAAIVDVEGHLDRKWALRMGVDVDRLAHILPENAEQSVDIACSLLQADDISIVGFDSLAAMATQAELEKDTEESVMGRQGLAINRFYRKVTSVLSDARSEGREVLPTLIVINQLRANIGVMHGDPEKQPGGRAFQFVSSLTVRLNGKDVEDKAISKKLPAFKEISVIIRKNKVPILSRKSVLTMALLPNPKLNLSIGEVYSWNTELQYLKQQGMLVQAKKGWDLILPSTGEVENYTTQDELKDRMRTDIDFATIVRGELIEQAVNSGDLIDGD